MDAVVLAGGYATRLWPITKHRPKMLLPIGQTTVIDRIFSELEEDDRIDNVYVSTNQRFEDDFTTHLSNSGFSKPQLTVEGTTSESEKPGVIGAISGIITREQIDDDLLVVAGDNLISFDMSDFIDYYQNADTPCLAAYDIGSVDQASEYGVLDLDGDTVVGFAEKPDDPDSTLISIACYAFPAELLSLFTEYLDSGNNPDEPGWFIQWLFPKEPVRAFTFDGAWFDIGTPNSYIEAIEWELDGRNIIADSARIENTTLGQNVHVMDNASIRDSEIDSSIVFPNVEIEDCDLRSSIIDEDTRLENLNLAGALIGAHTQISNGN